MATKRPSDDDQNESFGPGDRPLKNHKPGLHVEKGKRKEEQGRRMPSGAKDVPSKSLAYRIREKGGK